MKRFKEWPYWVKGGTVLVSLYAIYLLLILSLYIAVIFLEKKYPPNHTGCWTICISDEVAAAWLAVLPGLPILGPFMILGELLNIKVKVFDFFGASFSLPLALISIFVGYFLVDAFFGRVYGKIRNRLKIINFK